MVSASFLASVDPFVSKIKLDDAGNGDPVQVRNMLAAFDQNVEAQRGQHLTDEQADALLDFSADCDGLIGM